VRWTAVALTAVSLLSLAAGARAQPSAGTTTGTLSPDAQVQIAPTPPEGQVTLPTPPPEAPPPRPRSKGLVLEATMGALGFAGRFRHVAPPAYWMHTQLGYELFPWLMVFGEGELAYTTTGEAADESHAIAFPVWGFGGGARATLHATARVAAFLQGDAGALTAYVPHGALAVLGFTDAESLNLQLGGRAGLEWYQIDRHLALTLQAGLRDATGFARFAVADTPVMWDASAGLRYTF
jgi:hypothetical protein